MIVSEIANPGMLERWNCGLNSWWLIYAELPKTAVNPHVTPSSLKLICCSRLVLSSTPTPTPTPFPSHNLKSGVPSVEILIRKSIQRKESARRNPLLRVGSATFILVFWVANWLEGARTGLQIGSRMSILKYESARGYPFWVVDRQLDSERASSLQLWIPSASFWLCNLQLGSPNTPFNLHRTCQLLRFWTCALKIERYRNFTFSDLFIWYSGSHFVCTCQ